jgi:hypothetical protein
MVLCPFLAADFGGYVEDCFDCDEQGVTLPMPVPMGRQKIGADEGVKNVLFKVLLEVYRNDGYVCV